MRFKSGKYKCQYCPRYYTIMRTYHQHLEKVHPEKVRKAEPEPAATQEEGTVGIVNYACDGSLEILHEGKLLRLPANLRMWWEMKVKPRIQTRWIPLSEKLPSANPLNLSNSVEVLYVEDGRRKSGRIWFDELEGSTRITHWQPLPAPPEIK